MVKHRRQSRSPVPRSIKIVAKTAFATSSVQHVAAFTRQTQVAYRVCISIDCMGIGGISIRRE